MRPNYIAYDKDVTMKCLCVIGWAPYTYCEIKGAVSLLHPKHEIFCEKRNNWVENVYHQEQKAA